MNELDLLKKYMTDRRIERVEGVLKRRTRDVCVVIDRIDKPHNYMAALRSCDAFGIQDVHIIPFENEEDESISIKVTQGAHKWLTIKVHDNWQSCFEHLKTAGYKIYASHLSDEADGLEKLELGGRVALLFGNELNGLDREQVQACDGSFILPMYGFSQSFNVSVACALSLQRLLLARDAAGMGRGSLTEAEMSEMRLLWYRLAVPNSARILEEERRRGE